jgi:HSP20 family molecular chaperone IbpA
MEIMTNETACAPARATELQFVPRTRIQETAEAWEIVCEVPGADDQSAEISLEPDRLILNVRVQPTDLPGFQLVHREYREGNYQQIFKLPENIDRQGVEATIRQGVLRLKLPKLPVAQTRKVTVVAG